MAHRTWKAVVAIHRTKENEDAGDTGVATGCGALGLSLLFADKKVYTFLSARVLWFRPTSLPADN